MILGSSTLLRVSLGSPRILGSFCTRSGVKKGRWGTGPIGEGGDGGVGGELVPACGGRRVIFRTILNREL